MLVDVFLSVFNKVVLYLPSLRINGQLREISCYSSSLQPQSQFSHDSAACIAVLNKTDHTSLVFLFVVLEGEFLRCALLFEKLLGP